MSDSKKKQKLDSKVLSPLQMSFVAPMMRDAVRSEMYGRRVNDAVTPEERDALRESADHYEKEFMKTLEMIVRIAKGEAVDL